MPIRADRIAADIETIARFTPTPGAGSDRPTFSPAWRQARDFFCAEAERAGCHWRVDAAGNVHARPRGVDWSQRVWLSGSHLDSVPGGGDFDGVVGVVAALEVLRAAHDDGRYDLPLEAIVFAEEEGTTFGLGMLGSRGWAGTLDAAALAALRTREGKTYWEAGADHGAAILAPLVPTVMLFVASRDGISHNPAEFSRIDDIAAATRLLAAVVADLPAGT